MASQNTATLEKISRLGQILKVFFEQDKVRPSDLAERFETSKRSIQRDLKLLREVGFPINNVSQGCYRLDKNLFKDMETFDESELGLVIALKNIVSQLGPNFQRAADSVFNRLYQTIGNQSSLPVYINVDQPASFDSRLFNRIAKAIRTRKTVCFKYKVYSSYEVRIEPYKIVYYDGFWYLIGRDSKDGPIKRYALDKIEEFKILPKTFRSAPDDLDDILKGSKNIWFSGKRNLEVEVLVDQSCADYFKRRNMFPTQEIKKEMKDGSLVVSFKVGRFEEVISMIKAWLPNIKILKPKEFKKAFTEDIKGWLAWQQKRGK